MGAAPETPAQALAAAVLWFGPDALVSHCAAAALWGFPGFEPCVELSVASRSHWKGPGFPVHASPDLTPSDASSRQGFRVTSAARTLFDLCELCPDREVAIAMDDALRRRVVSPGQLRKLLFRLGRRGKAGTERFRRVMYERLRHAASGESPPETDLRRFIAAAGLPVPTPQHPITLNGQRKRIDLAYVKERIAIEVHSGEFHSDRYAEKNDTIRFRALERLGWIVLPVTPAELEEDPHPFLSELADFLEERGADLRRVA